jgi:hypothetical protein
MVVFPINVLFVRRHSTLRKLRNGDAPKAQARNPYSRLVVMDSGLAAPLRPE